MIGVVDTSAFLRLFIPDGPLPQGLEAFFRGVERGDNAALAPELMSAEAANVVSKKRLAGLLVEEECSALIELFTRFRSATSLTLGSFSRRMRLRRNRA